MTGRRNFIAASAAVLAGSAFVVPRIYAQPTEPIIKVAAKKFTYTPSAITIKMGVTTILELTTEDVVMGFNATDFGVRATLIPGQVTQVKLTPKTKGEFTFFCDVFCGTGHEDMNGTIRVV